VSARSEYFARKVAGYTPAVDPQTQLPVDAGDRVKHWHAQSNLPDFSKYLNKHRKGIQENYLGDVDWNLWRRNKVNQYLRGRHKQYLDAKAQDNYNAEAYQEFM